MTDHPHPTEGVTSPTPPDPSPDLARLVGQYGSPKAVLDLFERDGRLFARGHGLDDVDVTATARSELGEKALDLSFDPGASVRWAQLNGVRLERHDFGAEAVAAFQRTLKTATPGARFEGSPPDRAGFKPSDLVELRTLETSLRLDIRYATTNNFMGRPLYDRPAAYLQRPVGEALVRVHQSLRPEGFGLVVHDAYRPWSITRLFWEVVPEASRIFVANPSKGSQHNRGCAVDVALFDLATDAPAQATSDYDEATERSRADYPGGTSRQRWVRERLRLAMAGEGFTVHPLEWWHFDHALAEHYAVEDYDFDALDRLSSPPPTR